MKMQLIINKTSINLYEGGYEIEVYVNNDFIIYIYEIYEIKHNEEYWWFFGKNDALIFSVATEYVKVIFND